MTADEYLEFKQEYCTGKGRPVPEHEVAEAYAEKRLSEQWKPYPENQPEMLKTYFIVDKYGNYGVDLYRGHFGYPATHFMEIPKIPK